MQNTKKRIVISGIGVLAPNGLGKDDFWAGLKKGKSGIRPITLFETDRFLTNMAGEITDFDPKNYLGVKGHRGLDRATKLVVSAAKLALLDARLIQSLDTENPSATKIDEKIADDVAVSLGTTLGSVKSISDFDATSIKDGPRYTNPAQFPNTVINSPASQISIWCNIKGFNTTISTGFTSSIDATRYAYDQLQDGRVKVALTGGVEEMCYQTFLAFYRLKFLSGSRQDEKTINCPFDRRRNGIIFSEGACLFVLEQLGHAKERKANILGEILGFGYYFDPYRINKYNPKGLGVIEAISACLKDAGCKPDEIDYICANANSTPAADKIETNAIKQVFASRAYKIPVSSIKSMIGETFSASGAFAVAAAVGAINNGFIPPTINYKEKDPDCDLDIVANEARAAKVERVLVVNFGPNGACSCVVVGKI